MNTVTAHQTAEPTAATVARFKTLLAKHGLDYGITYRWHNRRGGYGDRYGILEVYSVEKGRLEGVVDREEFERQTHRWSSADETIGRVRQGSPKHRAIQALLVRLPQLFGAE